MLPTLTKKREVDSIIRDTIDKVLLLRFGRSSDAVCLQLDDLLYKSAPEVSKFASIAVVDIDSQDVQVYVKYFDITLIPSTVFFFNAQHMKMDSGLDSLILDLLNIQHEISSAFNYGMMPDSCKCVCFLVGSFHRKQDIIDVIEMIFRGAMKGKLIVTCPLPPERIPKFQLLYRDV